MSQMEPCSDSSLPDSQYAIKATPMHTFNLLIESRVRMQCPRCFTLAVASPGCWKSIDTPGSLPPEGAPGSPRQFNSFSTACHSPAAASMMKLESLSASPQVLLGSSPLPQTPPSQLSRAASSPPPLRRSRNTTSPPPASHPILSSAITVACTAAPDAIHSSGRLPIQRQLGFSFQNTQPPQHTSPFAAAATTPEPASLLDKTNSLPGPQHVPRTVLSDHKDSLSLQDSGMLTHMLHRATLLHTEREGHASGSSCNGPACSLPDAQTLRAKRCRCPAPPQTPPAPPESSLQAHLAPVSTYLSSSRSAFSKAALKNRADAVRHQGQAYQAPPLDPPGRALSLQRAATSPLLLPPDSVFSDAYVRFDRILPARSGRPSAVTLAHTPSKGHLPPSTAAGPHTPANPFCPPTDSSDFRHTAARLDANDQAVRAARYSPKGHLSWHLSDPSDGISYGQSESVSRSMQALNTAVVGAMPGPSPGSLSSRSLRAGGSVLTVSGDENSTHMRAASSEKLRPPSSGPAPLSRASDQGRASWHEARGPEARAASISLPGVLSPHGSLDYRTAASALDSQTGLECHLLLPHGTRGHKRPRLEDKLREGMAVRAFLADRHSNFDSAYAGG